MPTLRILSALLFGFAQALQAQTIAQDVVILNSQRSFAGIIVEQKPGAYIRLLRLPEHDTLAFPMDSIDRIVKIVSTEKPAEEPHSTSDPHKKYNQKKHIVMIHGHLGGGDYSFSGFGLSMCQNFADRWQLGLGVHYIGQTGNSNTITFPDQQIVPLTIECRWKFSESLHGKGATFLSLSSGYNFTLNKTHFNSEQNIDMRITNGLFFNPGIAFRINLFENMGLMLDLGYQLTSSSLFNAQTDKKIGGKQWHNFAARGTLFF